MSGLAKITKAIKAAKKVKKHGAKAGQKSLVKPSQKKSVKNGRHQDKQISKAKIAKSAKAVAAIPHDLDGAILDDEVDFTGDLEPESDFDGEETHYDEPDFDEDDKIDGEVND